VTARPDRSLHVAPGGAGVDIEAARRAAADFLAALGVDIDHEDLAETPARMARAYAELFSAPPLRLTTFANDEGYDELVLARAIPFRTVCEHHLLPFSGLAHVGYLPGERLLGLSKLARLVEHFAARPQVQERLTRQVADYLADRLDAPGVGVVLEAEHSCMTLRGVRAHGAKTVTSALLGTLRTDPASRAEFFALAGVPRLAKVHPDRRCTQTGEKTQTGEREMSGSSTYVIVGASLAGAKAAEALREEGFGGPVVLIGDEAERPYERPPLSKDYLLGKAERETIYVHPAAWYADHGVELRLGVPVTGIDRAAREVTLADGSRIGYARLLLATGSSPRRLPVPGAEAGGVLYLRRVGDSDQIKAAFQSASRVAVIGAGWIGLETTAAARAAGVEVTLLEAAELPLLRVLGAEAARVFAGLHREHGVDLRFGVQVKEITSAGGRAAGVRLGDGSHVEADAVIVGVGITPNTALAEAAGLETANGVVVDAGLRSCDPDIFAAGDVASAYHPLLGRHIRVEHWANALNQPEAAARAMLGQDVAYDEVPYFYTDQYDLGMEYAGYVEPGGYDQVVFRGDVARREFIAFWLGGGRVLAAMNVNVWDVNAAIQALVRGGGPVSLDRLADPAVPLDQVAEI
jgi:3-phenylpropionate/trans-cinnamate dioxygenase ferredoxin reductase component